MLYIFPCHLHAQMFEYKHDNNGNIISRTAQKPIDTTQDDLSDRTIDDKFIDVGISQENDKIIVEFTRSLDNEAEVNLYDTSSKLITKKTSADTRQELDSSSIPDGVYIIEVKYEDNVHTEKITKK